MYLMRATLQVPYILLVVRLLDWIVRRIMITKHPSPNTYIQTHIHTCTYGLHPVGEYCPPLCHRWSTWRGRWATVEGKHWPRPAYHHTSSIVNLGPGISVCILWSTLRTTYARNRPCLERWKQQIMLLWKIHAGSSSFCAVNEWPLNTT